jgi:hypothetical protein
MLPCRKISGIEFQMRIHVGDIVFDDNDIFGDGLNVAAAHTSPSLNVSLWQILL